MAVFPDIGSVPYTNPLEETIQYKTLVTRLNDLGDEQRRAKWLYPRRAFSLRYQAISVSQARTLWEFYMQRRGRYEAFNFFYPMTGTYTGEYVGTGDGSTTNFNAPCKSATGVTVYVDGVTVSASDYTYTINGGEDGADLITFDTAPDDGARITMDFTGYLKVRCRFAEDMLDFQTFYARLVSAGIKLQGLLNS